jgi:hypothetical protein
VKRRAQHGQQRDAEQQQDRLDDLHPRRRDHPPNSTYASITTPTLTTAHSYDIPNISANQVAGADHLREHVKEQREDAAECGAMRTGPAQRKATTSAKVNLPRFRSGSAIRTSAPASRPASRSRRSFRRTRAAHEAGDAEERGGAHVIAGECQPFCNGLIERPAA